MIMIIIISGVSLSIKRMPVFLPESPKRTNLYKHCFKKWPSVLLAYFSRLHNLFQVPRPRISGNLINLKMETNPTILISENDKDPQNEMGEPSPNIPLGARSTPDSCRETMKINYEEQSFHHHLTLGIQEKLQKNRMIRNVKMQFRKPVDKQTLGYFERKNGVLLPTDLKEYYQSTNGFKMTWSLEHAGDVLPIGELNINSLNQLVEIHAAAKQAISGTPSARGTASLLSPASSGRPKTSSSETIPRHLATLSASSARKNDSHAPEFGATLSLPFSELEQTLVGNESNGPTKLAMSSLNYSPDTKMFILDSGRCGWGKVCLVYPPPPGQLNVANKSSEPYVEIWFMDPSYQWHFLAPTFTHFYRMLLFHLGLPQWQYRFTPFGLSSWAEQIFWLVAPHLLQAPKLSRFPSTYLGEGLWCTDVPSEAAAPNSTLNVISNQLFRRKKKDAKEK